jgi:hypothetical protein
MSSRVPPSYPNHRSSFRIKKLIITATDSPTTTTITMMMINKMKRDLY